MAFEKMEKKVNRLKKHMKQGRVSEEIADEISNFISEVEGLGNEAREKFKDSIADMKAALKNLK